MRLKKVRLSILLLGCILISGSTVAQFAGGSGTEADPYQISTPQELDSVRNYSDAHFILLNDIDLDVAPNNTGNGWEPIGNSEIAFTGSFNGQDFSIDLLPKNWASLN